LSEFLSDYQGKAIKGSLFDMVNMQDELKTIFGRDVDLISKQGLENSLNHLRRKAILESAQVIHVAR
jgi:predicted nucleotidyltransferase